ncbi:hypothetical protein H8959_011733, partial [Pygathrix nigripes]
MRRRDVDGVLRWLLGDPFLTAPVNGTASRLDILRRKLQRLVLCPRGDSACFGIGVGHCRQKACRIPCCAAKQEQVYLTRPILLQSWSLTGEIFFINSMIPIFQYCRILHDVFCALRVSQEYFCPNFKNPQT